MVHSHHPLGACERQRGHRNGLEHQDPELQPTRDRGQHQTDARRKRSGALGGLPCLPLGRLFGVFVRMMWRACVTTRALIRMYRSMFIKCLSDAGLIYWGFL